MGQCVLRDCGLDPTKNTSSLENYLKKHLQDQYFENFLENAEKLPTELPRKNQDFVSSLNFPKKPTKVEKSLENSRNFSENPDIFNEKVEDFEEMRENPKFFAESSTKKVLPLLRNAEKPHFLDNFPKKPSLFSKPHEKALISHENAAISHENAAIPLKTREKPAISPKITTSEAHFEEDLLLSYKNPTKVNESRQNAANEHNLSGFSNVFQNQIFDNVNTTPSGIYKSDDENLEEYEKIFQDDEFSEAFEEDYVKKLTKDH